MGRISEGTPNSNEFRHASKSFRQEIECRLPDCEASGRPLCDLQEEPASQAEAEVQPQKSDQCPPSELASPPSGRSLQVLEAALERVIAQRGFSRIELGVVMLVSGIVGILLIGILQGTRQSLPSVSKARGAHQILGALTLYSGDFGGVYPEGSRNANEAYRSLFLADYIDSETPFWIRDGAPFCAVDPPDNLVEPEEKILEAGENGYGYVSGSTDSEPSGVPILYSGGYHHGSAARDWHIIGFRDGSASVIEGEFPKEAIRMALDQYPNMIALDPLTMVPSGSSDQE